MRWGALRATIVAAVAVSVLVAPSAGATKRPSCGHGGTTQAKTDQIRVYELSESSQYDLKVCHLRTGRRTTLYSWFDCGCSVADEPSPHDVWVAGRFVAVQTNSGTGPPGAGGPPSPRYSVELLDAKAGKSLEMSAGLVGKLVIKPRNGSIAYTRSGALHKLERGGQDKIVDPGPIKESSVRLEGSKLSWTKNGQSFSATLH